MLGDDRLVTIHDVAEHARVSVGTVSRVINAHPSVRPPIREAVLSSIRELGYQPNTLARDLRRSRTRTLGLVVPDLNNPQAVSLLRGAEDAAHEAGYSVVIAESRSDGEMESLHLQALLDRRVDGLLCAPVRSIELVARKAETAGVPVVIVSQRVPHRTVPTVYVEESTAINAAIDNLLALGHRRFAVIHADGNPSGRARSEQVRQRLAASGLIDTALNQLLWPFSGAAECEALVTRLLTAPEPPTALIIGGHQFLPAILVGVRRAAKAIPADVSLVAFGDSRWAEAMSPTVSVITSNQKQHAVDAVQMLLKLIDGDESAPRSIRSESVFIARESCGPARGMMAL